MKVKVLKSDFGIIQVGSLGEAKQMPINSDWFEVTFTGIRNPVPGYTTEGEVILAFKRDQLEFLEDDNPLSARIESLIQLIRTCNINQVKAQLECELKEFPALFVSLEEFYTNVSFREK